MNNKTSGIITRKRFVFAAVFAAIISVGALASVNMGALGIPLVIQDMLALLSGLILGGLYGALSVAVYLIAGALGLPVFAGGTGGLAKFFGPTGGFLAGYMFASLAAGIVAGMPSLTAKRGAPTFIKLLCAAVFGQFVLYVCGAAFLTLRLMESSGSFSEALKGAVVGGVLPFLPAASVKISVAAALSFALRPVAARYINPGE